MKRLIYKIICALWGCEIDQERSVHFGPQSATDKHCSRCGWLSRRTVFLLRKNQATEEEIAAWEA